MVNFGVMVPETEKKNFVKQEPLPDKWWVDVDWINLKDHEPTAYELLFDFFINKISPDPETVILASEYPPRSVLFCTYHKSPGYSESRGWEYNRMRLSPATVVKGAPAPGSNIEVDAIIWYYDYYDFAKMLLGYFGPGDPICDGRATYVGNFTAFLDVRDVIVTAQGEEGWPYRAYKQGLIPKGDETKKGKLYRPDRPLMWPDGHP
ncbi:MAG: hypothetical protein ACXQS7_01845 [Candidatus Syntropharchaeia archaeon]